MADESDHPVGGGLITQRMQAERGRAVAIVLICLGIGWLVVGVVAAFAPLETFLDWLGLVGRMVVGVSLLYYGIFQLRERAKRVAAFNAEHGEDAGRQPTL